MEETCASIKEMNTSVQQNAENATVTENMANQSSRQGQEGGEAVQRTVLAMKKEARHL